MLVPGRYVQDRGPAHDDADTGDTGCRWNLVQEQTGGANQNTGVKESIGMDRDRSVDSIARKMRTRPMMFRTPEVITAPYYAGPITGKPRAAGITRSRIPDRRKP